MNSPTINPMPIEHLPIDEESIVATATEHSCEKYDITKAFINIPPEEFAKLKYNDDDIRLNLSAAAFEIEGDDD